MKTLNLIPKTHAADAIGTLSAPGSIVSSSTELYKFFSAVTNLLIVLSGLWFFFSLLIAGFTYISGAGDPKKTQESMKKITDSLVGLAIVAAAFIITAIISRLFFGEGFNILQPSIKTIQDFQPSSE